MKKISACMVFVYLSISTNLFSSVHEERMKLRRELFYERVMQQNQNEEVREYMTSVKALACICLLLTPVSWKHVITVPCQLQLSQPSEIHESQFFDIIGTKHAENFVKTSTLVSYTLQPQITSLNNRYRYKKNQHTETNAYFCDEKDQKFKKNGNLRSK